MLLPYFKKILSTRIFEVLGDSWAFRPKVQLKKEETLTIRNSHIIKSIPI